MGNRIFPGKFWEGQNWFRLNELRVKPPAEKGQQSPEVLVNKYWVCRGNVVVAASGAPCSGLEQKKGLVKCSPACEQQSAGPVEKYLQFYSFSVLLIWCFHASYQVCWVFHPNYFSSSYSIFSSNYPQWIFLSFVGMQIPEEFCGDCTNKQKTSRFSRWSCLVRKNEALDSISLTLYLSLPNLLNFLLVFHWANNHVCVNQELSLNSFCHMNFTMPSMIKTSYL